MKPQIDIVRVKGGTYAYSVGTGAAVGARADSGSGPMEFDSLERCLSDAGDALVPYFTRIDVQFAGRYLGSCSTRYMCTEPVRLAARIRQAVAGAG